MSIKLTALGLRIRNLRITKNLTQEALAEKTNTSRVFIGLIENGDRAPGLETFVALANALHASTDALLMDSLHASGSDITSQAREILSDCSPLEASILIENMRNLRASLRKLQSK